MNTVTIGVASRDAISARVAAAMKGSAQEQFITFESVQDLFQTLTQLRWNLISAMTGAGPLSIREVARRVERDVKRVHDDVHVLLNVGVLERTADGLVVFPYDAVHVDFTFQAKAA